MPFETFSIHLEVNVFLYVVEVKVAIRTFLSQQIFQSKVLFFSKKRYVCPDQVDLPKL